MESCVNPLPRRKAAVGKARESLLCLRLCSRKKKAGYSAHMHKLLNQTWHTGASCLAATTLDWLSSPQPLGEVALEAARLSRYGKRSRLRLTYREVLLAVKLVLLRELCRTRLGAPGWQQLLQEWAEM